jgi:hypothetical protein
MQGELDFGSRGEPREDGMALWRRERETQQLEMARKLGLPIGREVEVWLQDGVRLRGKLRLHEESLLSPECTEQLRLEVDRTVFVAGEIERCLRI